MSWMGEGRLATEVTENTESIGVVTMTEVWDTFFPWSRINTQLLSQLAFLCVLRVLRVLRDLRG